jgi:hypothetical protein
MNKKKGSKKTYSTLLIDTMDSFDVDSSNKVSV